MNCRQLQESLGDYSVGLLEHQKRVEFESHVKLCADCAKNVRQFRRCLELLDHTTSPRPPAELWMSVRASLEVERAVQAHTRHAHGISLRRPWRSSLAATAAGFATAAIVMAGLSARRTGTPITLADDTPVVSVSESQSPFLDFAPSIIPATDTGTENDRHTITLSPNAFGMPQGRPSISGGQIRPFGIPPFITHAWPNPGYPQAHRHGPVPREPTAP